MWLVLRGPRRALALSLPHASTQPCHLGMSAQTREVPASALLKPGPEESHARLVLYVLDSWTQAGRRPEPSPCRESLGRGAWLPQHQRWERKNRNPQEGRGGGGKQGAGEEESREHSPRSPASGAPIAINKRSMVFEKSPTGREGSRQSLWWATGLAALTLLCSPSNGRFGLNWALAFEFSKQHPMDEVTHISPPKRGL